MNDNKFFMALKKSAFVFSLIYTLTIVLFATIMKIESLLINPIDIVILFFMYVLLSVITGIRFYIDGSKWSLNLPFFVKNLIVAPLYLVITFAGVMSLTGMSVTNKPLVIFVIAVFVVTFIISNLVKYAIDKSKTDDMNDALTKFLEEHPYGDEE